MSFKLFISSTRPLFSIDFLVCLFSYLSVFDLCGGGALAYLASPSAEFFCDLIPRRVVAEPGKRQRLTAAGLLEERGELGMGPRRTPESSHYARCNYTNLIIASASPCDLQSRRWCKRNGRGGGPAKLNEQ